MAVTMCVRFSFLLVSLTKMVGAIEQVGDEASAALRELNSNGIDTGNSTDPVNGTDENVTTTTTMADENMTTTTTAAGENMTTTTTAADGNMTTTTTAADTNTTTTAAATTTTTEANTTTTEAATTTTDAATTTTGAATTTTGNVATTTTDPNATTSAPVATFFREIEMPLTLQYNCDSNVTATACASTIQTAVQDSAAAQTQLESLFTAAANLTAAEQSAVSYQSVAVTPASSRRMLSRRALQTTARNFDLAVKYNVTVTSAQDTALATKVNAVQQSDLTTYGTGVENVLKTEAGLGNAVTGVTANTPVFGPATGPNAPSSASTTSAASGMTEGVTGFTLLASMLLMATSCF